MLGVVKHYNSEKGFGFIIGEDGKDYFYHISDAKDVKLVEYGDKVKFEKGYGKKGIAAKNITVTEKRADRELSNPWKETNNYLAELEKEDRLNFKLFGHSFSIGTRKW